MEEQNTVNIQEESAPATVFAFGPEDQVDADQNAESAGEEAQTTESEQVEEKGVDGHDGEQKDIGKAFAEERKRIEAKYAKKMTDDPSYRLGEMMIADLMETGGLSRDEAVKRATDNFIKAVAKRDGISPNVAKKLYAKEVKAELEESAPDADEEADRIVREFYEAEKPTGFDEKAALADSEFVQLLTEYPAKAAIRIWMSERSAKNAGQDLAEKLKARNAIPQMTRSGHAVSPTVDWTRVDSETFRKEKERRSHLR